MSNTDELKILQFVHEHYHPTATDIWHALFSHLTKRSVELKIQELLQHKLLGRKRMYVDGGGSVQYYHLQIAGARLLGLDRLSTHQYRTETRQTLYQAKHTRLRFALLCEQHGWILLKDQEQAKASIRSFLLEAAFIRHGEHFPAHTLEPFLPKQISPDLVLLTQSQEPIIIIFASLHATSVFWKRRLERYKSIIETIRAVCIVIPDQRLTCEQIIGKSQYAKRFLILSAENIDELAKRLHLNT